MLDALCRVLVAFLAILGVTELYRVALFWILQPGWGKKTSLLLTFRGHDETAEHRMRSAVEQIRWMRGSGEKEVVCVDCGMDGETRAVCEKFARDCLCVRLISVESLPGFLNGEFANTYKKDYTEHTN